jgi:hypothetical protein
MLHGVGFKSLAKQLFFMDGWFTKVINHKLTTLDWITTIVGLFVIKKCNLKIFNSIFIICGLGNDNHLF